MHAILIHGMGRSPLSMGWLGLRLRLAGYSVSYFSYSAAREGFIDCVARLQAHIRAHANKGDYLVAAHSLGTVLVRAALVALPQPPRASFLIAPPTQACAMAKRFAGWRLFRWMTGECGQLLANADLMRKLPPPPANTTLFAGCGGPRLRWLPYGRQENDGILAVAETRWPGLDTQQVRALHTFIMNHRQVVQTICQTHTVSR